MRCLCSALRAPHKQRWKDQSNGYLSTKVRKTLDTTDNPQGSTEGVLEAIQMAWLEQRN